MTASRLMIVVAALALPGCRKVPTAATYEPPVNATPAATPIVQVAARHEPAKEVIDHHGQVIVLGYHRFVEKVRHPDTEMTPEMFEAQMQTLKDSGITVIPLRQYLGWRQEKNEIPARSAIITIDDGYDSAYKIAWPILKKFGYPFTLFIYTDYVKGGPKSGGASMTWQQLAEMRDAGVDIQSHTVSHADLRGRRQKARGQDYEKWLWNELHGSKEILEQKLGISVTALAVPYGYYDEHVKEVASTAGYEMLFTVAGAKLDHDTSMNALGRYMLRADQPKVFTTAVDFGAGMAGALAATSLDVRSLGVLPADGTNITEHKPVIRARLEGVGEVDPASVHLRMSGVGLLPTKFDPADGVVSSEVTQPLEPGTYTVIISAEADGHRVEGHWKFTVVETKSGALAGRVH